MSDSIYRDPTPYCPLGDKPESHHPDGIWEFKVEDFAQPIDPKAYFVTSGEAIRKAEQLEKDVWELAGKVRKLRNLLKKVRGSAVYLETEHTGNNTIILKQKNPRNRSKHAKSKT